MSNYDIAMLNRLVETGGDFWVELSNDLTAYGEQGYQVVNFRYSPDGRAIIIALQRVVPADDD